VTGCGTRLERYSHTPSETDGELYIYRAYDLLKSGVIAVLFVNDAPIANLNTNEYVHIPVNSSEYSIAVNAQTYTGENVLMKLSIAAGETKYIEILVDQTQYAWSFAGIWANDTNPFYLKNADKESFFMKKDKLEHQDILSVQ